jgi:hypothetical protein
MILFVLQVLSAIFLCFLSVALTHLEYLSVRLTKRVQRIACTIEKLKSEGQDLDAKVKELESLRGQISSALSSLKRTGQDCSDAMILQRFYTNSKEL